jgi:hypothetical protein
MLHTDGTATAVFSLTPNGSYYIVVKYRNAITTWSASPQTLSMSTLTYDFSNSLSKAYGNNQKLLESGVYGFYSGDLNQDGFIEAMDFPSLYNASDLGAEGNYASDMNGDGFVEANDFPYLYNNSDLGVESMHP